VTAGAVAVYIPLHFAPLLAGRWDLAEDHRRIVTWYHRDFMRPYKNLPKAEFASSDTFPEYLPFILLSKSRLKSQYRERKQYRISPSSNILSSIIAIIQTGFSIRQLTIHYEPSIAQSGSVSIGHSLYHPEFGQPIRQPNSKRISGSYYPAHEGRPPAMG